MSAKALLQTYIIQGKEYKKNVGKSKLQWLSYSQN